jgi:predicted ATPase/DNA-binding winged helix-turn-helix (wHTH) protein
VHSEAYVFGTFRLMPSERTLLDGDRPLRLGSRALDILVTLVEHAGETVQKDELIARAWPDTIVDEASLRVHIAALRKTLGDGREGNRFITNIPGRGYVFVAPATRERASETVESPRPTVQGNDIPGSLTRIIGREGTVSALSAQLAQRRLLTIIGPGGIGKTTAAAAVAEAVRELFPDGVWFVGLASVPKSDLVASAVGAVIGISLPGDNPVDGLTAWLRDKQALIILDNCEHVIGAAAALAEEIIRAAPGIRILATSREPLRAVGEWRHRLAPLSFPSEAADLDTSAALQFSAIQLFSERASASVDEFTFDESDIPALVKICRRLDGVPLALELAAAHVGVLGIKGLAARLDDRFALLIQGRRTALPRHQTLRATLDWSYELLPETEQVILRRLAVFQGEFTMDAAAAVAADVKIIPDDVVNGIANLVDKSLVAADISGEVTYYHLLELTRSYAQERLRDSGERDNVSGLHCGYYHHVFASAEVGSNARSKQEWVSSYARHVGSLRAALDWAFSPACDTTLGVALVAAATDFWIAMSLLSECCDWGLRAVAQLGPAAGSRDEMRLQSGLGKALTYSRGMGGDAKAAIIRSLALAEALGDAEYQLRSTYTLWLYALRVVDLEQCLQLAHACGRLAETMHDASAKAMANFAMGQTQYYLGQHAAAAANLAHARAIYPIEMRGGDPIRLGADLLTCCSCYEAMTLWSLGKVDQAYKADRDAITQACEINHAVSLCTALAAPSSILLVKMGFLEEAERCIDALIKHADEHSLTPFYAFGLCSKGGLMAARGDLAEAERLLRLGLQRSREIGYLLFDAYFQGELAAVMASAGRIEEGLIEIDAALRYADQSQSLWCTPELLRIKGELLAGRADNESESAEEWFVRSCALAREQGALSWELRATVSLARFWRDHCRGAEAHQVLSKVHRTFTEGFNTAAVTAAGALLESIAA